MTILQIRSEAEAKRFLTGSVPKKGVALSGLWLHRTKEDEEFEVEIISYDYSWNGRKARLVHS